MPLSLVNEKQVIFSLELVFLFSFYFLLFSYCFGYSPFQVYFILYFSTFSCFSACGCPFPFSQFFPFFSHFFNFPCFTSLNSLFGLSRFRTVFPRKDTSIMWNPENGDIIGLRRSTMRCCHLSVPIISPPSPSQPTIPVAACSEYAS